MAANRNFPFWGANIMLFQPAHGWPDRSFRSGRRIAGQKLIRPLLIRFFNRHAVLYLLADIGCGVPGAVKDRPEPIPAAVEISAAVLRFKKCFLVKLQIGKRLSHISKVKKHTGIIGNQKCRFHQKLLHIVVLLLQNLDPRMVGMKQVRIRLQHVMQIKNKGIVVLIQKAVQRLVV